MDIFVYNTLSQSKEKFIPLEPGKVKLYLCGPTVYNFLHIGNFRGPIVFNLLRNFLDYMGYQVTFVYNYTDVDDKIIQRSLEEKVTPLELTQKYIKEFEYDFKQFELTPHEFNPRVTDFIPQIISFVQGLVENKKAYINDGEVLYDIAQFESYGKLSKKKMDENQAGIRVQVDERKRNSGDFVLWKPAKANEISWDSPWGKGRPGWHIECSAMIKGILGTSIDIHGGGIDLIFPHHENEIAQGEGLHECSYCRYWMHNNFININDDKMSKSLGNIITARQFNLEYHPELLKYLFLSVHYRSILSISEDKIFEAIKGIDRIYLALATAEKILMKNQNQFENKNDEGKVHPKLKSICHETSQKIKEALADDLNSAEMIAGIFEVCRLYNSIIPKNLLKINEENFYSAIYFSEWTKKWGKMLSLFQQNPQEMLVKLDNILLKKKNIDPAQIDSLVLARTNARNLKDFNQADQIRKELELLGVELYDDEGESRWRVKK